VFPLLSRVPDKTGQSISAPSRGAPIPRDRSRRPLTGLEGSPATTARVHRGIPSGGSRAARLFEVTLAGSGGRSRSRSFKITFLESTPTNGILVGESLYGGRTGNRINCINCIMRRPPYFYRELSDCGSSAASQLHQLHQLHQHIDPVRGRKPFIPAFFLKSTGGACAFSKTGGLLFVFLERRIVSVGIALRARTARRFFPGVTRHPVAVRFQIVVARISPNPEEISKAEPRARCTPLPFAVRLAGSDIQPCGPAQTGTLKAQGFSRQPSKTRTGGAIGSPPRLDRRDGCLGSGWRCPRVACGWLCWPRRAGAAWRCAISEPVRSLRDGCVPARPAAGRLDATRDPLELALYG
jgi:hypothetical protein